MSLSRDDLVGFLTEQVAKRIGAEAARDRDGDLFELGLDSVEAVELTGELESRYGLEIDPSLAFEERTINRLADSLLAAM